MKIRELKAERVEFKLSRPYSISYFSVDAVENIIVKVSTAGGETGFGCAAPMSLVTGETIDSSLAVLESGEVQSVLKGGEVAQVHALIEELASPLSSNPAARAAVEMALFDLLGKLHGLPLYRFYTRTASPLPTSITIGIKSVEESLKEAREYLSRGFKSIKVKLGKNPEEDIERMRKLRETCGPEVSLRVDMNQGYTAEELNSFFQAADGLNIELVEQPLPTADYRSMEKIERQRRKICAADENLHGPVDALELLQPEPHFGIYNIKLMKSGGPVPARRIADIAALAGIELMWGCNDESRISISAALNTALSCSGTRYLDLDGHLDLTGDVAEGGFTIKEGIMYPSDEPGLGVKVH
ncbi:MAG: mandelate racemase/muconate lactonizing enzyme family protein [Spirochaetaceae bacterium]